MDRPWSTTLARTAWISMTNKEIAKTSRRNAPMGTEMVTATEHTQQHPNAGNDFIPHRTRQHKHQKEARRL
eukprot:5172081-Ditylum_brightwellii.AAC.1